MSSLQLKSQHQQWLSPKLRKMEVVKSQPPVLPAPTAAATTKNLPGIPKIKIKNSQVLTLMVKINSKMQPMWVEK